MTEKISIKLIDKIDLDEHPKFEPNGEDKKLFDAIRHDKLIIFYGAGVSRLAGCASWIELAKNIANAFPKNVYSELDKEVLREIAEVDPKRAISICYRESERNINVLKNIYFKALRKSVTPTNKKEFVEIHKKIFNLNALSYITTNIDRGVETVNRKKRYLVRKKIIDLTNSKKLNPKNEIRKENVFCLHGTVSNIEKTIFADHDYFKFYANNKINDFLQEIFRGEYSVLFIGYSLNEYEVLKNIFLAIDKQNKEIDLNNHFLLSPIYSKDIAKFNIEREYFKIFSINAKPYFIDYDGYGRLKYVLDLLKKEIEQYRPDILSVHQKIDQV